MSIESYLEKHARQTPTKVAIVCQGGNTLTYGDLWERTVLRAESLKAEGVKPRQIHLFRASQNEDFLITYFALHVIGAIAAPLECDFPEETFVFNNNTDSHKYSNYLGEEIVEYAKIFFDGQK